MENIDWTYHLDGSKGYMKLSNERARLLWKNSKDSIRHALGHFSELSDCDNDEEYHHKKWIILSVHHSAETFAYMLLKELDETNKAFYRNGSHYYPGLKKTVQVLLHLNFREKTTESEKNLLKLFKKLDLPRNKIIHGEIPERMDVSIMAMAIVGIFRMSHKICGESTDDMPFDSSTIQKDVIEAVHWSKLDEYTKFIEAFIQEDNQENFLDECPSCGRYSVLHNQCEACFEELDLKECPHCQEENLQIHGVPIPDICGSCGKELPT